MKPSESEPAVALRKEVRPLILSLLKAQKEVPALDLLESLTAQGIEEETIRAVLIAMLAESQIQMTPTRKLRVNAECAIAACA